MTGKIISHYKVLEKLGGGGMGIVYKARDLKLDRYVALKFLPPSFSLDDESKKRFIHEAKAASTLQHHNICTIHEIDEVDSQLFICMDFYDGETLRSKIENKLLSIEEAINIAVQIAKGVSKAHQNNIIHRDIKPANIFISKDGIVKILDFGLAKIIGQTKISKPGSTSGTVAYMSPEQARGETVDNRTDIWSLGVVLYEMITGINPFKAEYDQAVIHSILNKEPELLKTVSKDIPEQLKQIISKAMSKNRDLRYSTLNEFIKDLDLFLNPLRSENDSSDVKLFFHSLKKPRIAIPIFLLILILFITSIWYFNRSANIAWAKEEALPEIIRLLNENEYSAAFQIATEAKKYIPEDTTLMNLLRKLERNFSVETIPAGADIYIKDYGEKNVDWENIGKSPIDKIKIARSFKCWKITKEGYETIIATDDWRNKDSDIVREFGIFALSHINFKTKLDTIKTLPGGMVKVTGAESRRGWLNDFYLDKFEVSNKEYKDFVDNGGYLNKDYWKYPFVKDHKIINWNEAMLEFVDATGRPGPSNWVVGDYPDRYENYPVTGVSWYEAAAYAEFVGKSLPTIWHWGLAAGLANEAFIIPKSNFQGEGPVQVGKFEGIGPFGTYDMAGNVSEWNFNESGEYRTLSGGSCSDPTYMFRYLDSRPPFYRSKNIGFRCMKILPGDTILQATLEPHKLYSTPDMRKEKPCSDEVFQIYKSLYTYSKSDLDAVVELRDESQKDYIFEKVTFNAAYGSERMIAYIYIPKKEIQKPYQTVIFFPPAGIPNSIMDFSPEPARTIINSGRAFVFPVYHDVFERQVPPDWKWTKENDRDHVIMAAKDLSRTIDYLETRTDLDADKLGYFGISWGAWMGVILNAVEDRFKAVILTAGGLSEGNYLPEARPLNFAPRVKAPTLLLNGKYDRFFPVELNVNVLLNLLGSSNKNKKLILLESGHDVWSNNKYRKEVLDWLDHYLGPVK